MSPLELRSPLHERESVFIPAEVSHLKTKFNGTVCSNKGDEYSIKNNVLDLLGELSPAQTLAQSSNHWKLTAEVYEDYWRKNALSLMTGEAFPLTEEQRILKEWLPLKKNDLCVDVGCSTAFYARSLKQTEPSAQLIALDFSREMLIKAREKALQDETDLFLLRADAEKMPFFSETIHALCCGGTLNEFRDPLKVLFEMRRVIKKDGAVFMMYLLEAASWYGRMMQEGMKLGGLHFWTFEESHELFKRAGFSVEKYIQRGIVSFALLRPA